MPVVRKAEGINTGLGVHNPGTEDVDVNCTLMKDGDELDTVKIELMANHQDARFIDELFTEADMSDFSGSVKCEAGGRITGVALGNTRATAPEKKLFFLLASHVIHEYSNGSKNEEAEKMDKSGGISPSAGHDPRR